MKNEEYYDKVFYEYKTGIDYKTLARKYNRTTDNIRKIISRMKNIEATKNNIRDLNTV